MTTPFDFDAFLTGAPAETKRGVKVVGHHLWSDCLTYLLDARLASGRQLSYTKNGEVVNFGNSMDNLVMSGKG